MRRNASPRWDYKGIKDVSARAPIVIPEQMPQHLPFIYTYASTGPYDEVVYGYGDILNQVFGNDFLDYRAKHITHATPLIDVMNRAANKMGIIRLPAPGSARARVALGLDVIAAIVPLYELDDSGFPIRENGALVETGETTAGYIMRWVRYLVPANTAYGTLQPMPGNMVNGETQSVIYPIVEGLYAHDGDPGNLAGIRLYAPSTLSADPLDTDLVTDQKAMLYRMQVVRKLTPRSSPSVWETLTEAQDVEFALNPDAINEAFDTEMHFDKVFLQSYRNMDYNESGVRTYGPFEKIKFYQQHVDALSALVQASEGVFPDMSTAAEDKYMVNIVSFKYPNGAPYQSVQLQGIMDGGLEMSEISTHYLEGGASGDMTAANFELAVQEQLLQFGSGAIKWRNLAKYPAHQFYDTGFGLTVKDLIPRITAVRPNIAVYCATHIAGLPQQTMDEESSMAVALNGKMQAFPESIVAGTSFTRGVIVAGSGQMIDSKYSEFCPGTIDLAYKKALYQGASDGRWKSEFAYDQDGSNQVSVLKNINNTYRPDEVRNKDWANGVVYWQDYDRMVAFYPGIQTAYVNDTSVLNSEMVMTACLYLSTVTFDVWKSLTGNQKLTDDQLIERSNEKVLQLVQDKFDGRFIIVPETILTPEDTQLGYSWSCKVHIYANNMRTVFAAAIIAHRMEDLNG